VDFASSCVREWKKNLKIKQRVYFELSKFEKFFFQKHTETLSLYTSDLILEPKTHFASERLHLICYPNAKLLNHPTFILAHYSKCSCPALTRRASDWEVIALPRHTFKAQVLRLLQQFLAMFSAVLSFEA